MILVYSDIRGTPVPDIVRMEVIGVIDRITDRCHPRIDYKELVDLLGSLSEVGFSG